MIELRKYQKKCIENFKKWMMTSEKIGSITIPVGTGKTISAAFCLATQPDIKILWVAHRQELITQAFDALKLAMPGRSIEIEMAEQKANVNSDIVVGSVQTIARSRKHLNEFNPDIIVIDEWHHFSENNIQYAGLTKRWPNAKLLCLTATPFRSNGEILPLGTILITMDIGTAIDNNYLVTPKPESLLTNVSLADIKVKMGDFTIQELSKTINIESRNKLIISRIVDLVRSGRQGVCFAADVNHSKTLTELASKEIRVAEIYGDTNPNIRIELMNRIRNREIDCVFNNMIMTEGTDVPHWSFACMARPTKLIGLYQQCVGRVLRLSENKYDAIIIDVHDKVKVKQTRITFVDMAESGDIYGNKKRAVNVLKAEVPLEPLTDKLVNFPILIKKHQTERWTVDDESFSISSWAVGSEQWIVTWTCEIKQPKIISKSVFVPWIELPPPNANMIARAVQHEKFGLGKVVRIADRDNPKIVCDFGWEQKTIEMTSLKVQKFVKEYSPSEIESIKVDKLYYLCMPEIEPQGRVISFTREGRNLLLVDDKRLDRFQAEAFLQEEAVKDGVLPLVRTNAKWKAAPASDKQKELVTRMLNRIGFDIDMDSLTKGDASAIIDQAKWQEVIQNKFGADYKEKLLGYDKDLHDV